jgi:hypothetical protein
MIDFKYLHLSYTVAYFLEELFKKYLYSEIFYSMYLANTLGCIYLFIEACVTLRTHNSLKTHNLDGE